MLNNWLPSSTLTNLKLLECMAAIMEMVVTDEGIMIACRLS